MSTYSFLRKRVFLKKKKHCWAPRLQFNPQKKGVVMRLRIITPRKPNSARRQSVKIYLRNKKWIIAYIPGSGHNLRRHSKVLVRGGGARDLPGVYYSCVRGVYDFIGILTKTKRRSIYGVSCPPHLKTYVRRKLRQQ
jgi:small subunit ribosomal protein S12